MRIAVMGAGGVGGYFGGLLARAGHEVTARNRDEATDDSVLSALDTLDYDQLWLMAVDTGQGLSPGDSAGIMRFREGGGGVLTARDHQDLGSCLVCLGSIGQLNHFHNQNPEPDARRAMRYVRRRCGSRRHRSRVTWPVAYTVEPNTPGLGNPFRQPSGF